ncbi:hypothetical protein HUJ04_012855, partial [Dendroctonus ponderosae]
RELPRSKRGSWQKFCGGVEPLPDSARLANILSADKTQKDIGTLKKEDVTWTETKKETLQLLAKHFPGCCIHITIGIKLQSDVLYDSLIIHILTTKLDKSTLREWKEFHYENELPTLDKFVNFLKDKSDLLQSLEQTFPFKTINPSNHDNNKSYRDQGTDVPRYQVHLSTENNYSVKCNICQKGHTTYKCPEFLALPISDRLINISCCNLCENCLRVGHQAVNCKNQNKILKHNTLLHFKDFSVEVPSSINMIVGPETSEQTQVHELIFKAQDSVIFSRAVFQSITLQEYNLLTIHDQNLFSKDTFQYDQGQFLDPSREEVKVQGAIGNIEENALANDNMDLQGDIDEHGRSTWRKYVPADLKQPITINLQNPRPGSAKRKNDK